MYYTSSLSISQPYNMARVYARKSLQVCELGAAGFVSKHVVQTGKRENTNRCNQREVSLRRQHTRTPEVIMYGDTVAPVHVFISVCYLGQKGDHFRKSHFQFTIH